MAKKKKDNPEPTVSLEEYRGAIDKIRDFKRDKDLNLHQRLHLVMMEAIYVQKRPSAEYYNTVEHDDVLRTVRPALLKYGVNAILTKINVGEHKVLTETKTGKNGSEYEVMNHFTQAEVYVKFVNIDNPEDFEIVPAYGHGIDRGSNAPGKAISYGVKYCFLKGLNLETGDEEDRYPVEEDQDENIVFLYNSLGEELFGDDWEKISKKKIFSMTKGQTSVAERAPAKALNNALKNLYLLKKKKKEEPEKDIKEINEEVDKKSPESNEILDDFK